MGQAIDRDPHPVLVARRLGMATTAVARHNAVHVHDYANDGDSPMDPETVAAMLSSEYPEIDGMLIHTLISDYTPAELPSALSSIRDQLGIFQASLVPDSRAVSPTLDDLALAQRLHDEEEAEGRRSDAGSEGRSRPASLAGWTSDEGSWTETSNASSAGQICEADEELDLLRSLFPALPKRDLRKAWRIEPNIEAAIEHLLSIELIRGVEQSGYWSDEADGLAVSLPGSASMTPNPSDSTSASDNEGFSKQRRQRRRKRVPIDELSTQDDEPASPLPESHPTWKTPSPPLEVIAPVPRRQNQANAERFLSKPTKLLSPRLIPGSEPALSSALNPTATDDFGRPSPGPSGSTRSKRMPGDKRQIHPKNWHKATNVRPTRTSTAHPYASHIPSYARGALPHDSTPGALYGTANGSGELSMEECLRRAQLERQRRELSIREVGRSFRAGSGGRAIGGAVAGHHALQAREAMDRAKHWELRAARMVVDSQMAATKGNTIDLHHMTVHEACTVAEEAAAKWHAAQSPLSGGPGSRTSGLVIVTGKGNHSAGRKGVLGPAVASSLEHSGWRVDRGDSARGYIVVKGRR